MEERLWGSSENKEPALCLEKLGSSPAASLELGSPSAQVSRASSLLDQGSNCAPSEGRPAPAGMGEGWVSWLPSNRVNKSLRVPAELEVQIREGGKYGVWGQDARARGTPLARC